MILYGRYLSPYVRRVAIWLALQGRSFEHRPILIAGEDFARLRTINPLGRVPVLVPEDGEALVETSAIIDWLEDTAPRRAARLLPRTGAFRRLILQQTGFATGVADKAVALAYERQRRPEQYHWPEWQQRLEMQIVGGLDHIESFTSETGYFGGSRPKGVDVAVVCAYDQVEVMHPQLLAHPKLKALSRRANRREAFAASHPRTVAP